MANEEARDSDVIDPLAAYSGIKLFPSTFGVFPDPSKPHDLGTDLDDIHKHLKSMASGSPSKLIEQARTILDGNSNGMHSEISTYLLNNEEKKENTAKVEKNPQERRPALNRKRARFSLKPDARQPAVNMEPTFNIKQLKDPEEFFLAYERLENAKLEIRKQTGGFLKDLNEQNPSMNTRQRRPGILRRSVRYKHQYSSITSEDDQNVEPSQVTFESGNIRSSTMGTEKDPGPPIIGSEKRTGEHVPFEEEEEEEEEELVASITKSENKVSRILDELLSANCEDLEGDRAINKLQECLQIKPINLEKLCLPDLQAIQTVNLKYSRGNPPKRSLFCVDNQLQRIETSKFKQDDESSVHSLSTPSSMKSPLASLSALNRKILLSNSSSDPFSAHDINQSPARNPSISEHIKHLSDIVDIAKQSSVSKLKSPLTEDGEAVPKGIRSPESPIGDVDSISKISLTNVLNVPEVGGNAALSGTHTSMEAKEISGSDTEVEVNAHAADGLANNASNALDDEMEDHEELASEQLNTSKVDATKEFPFGIQSQLDQSTTTSSDNIVDGVSRSSVTDHHDKVKPKSRANKQRKNKNISRRQSLAAAGTKWESGVRRSTRFKTRPLEYWKGERLLYGRVHQSLATVIGMKYVSPAKGNGQPTLKVKSLVSSKYKELVELAALH